MTTEQNQKRLAGRIAVVLSTVKELAFTVSPSVLTVNVFAVQVECGISQPLVL